MSAEAMQWLQDQLGQQQVRPKEPQGVVERLERRVADLEREVQALRGSLGLQPPRHPWGRNPYVSPMAPGLPGLPGPGPGVAWCVTGVAPGPLPRDAAMDTLREHVL